jgi:hypothetical protein
LLIIWDFDPNVYPVVGGGKIRVFNTVVENGVESREVVHNQALAKPLRLATHQKSSPALQSGCFFNNFV